MRFYAKAAVAWALLATVMVANGFFRGLVLEPFLGHHVARQVASVIGACIVVAVAGVFVHRLPDPARAPLARAGLLWGALTVAFELGLGLFVSGLSLGEILADYDLSAGRLWPLVLLTTVLAPPFWGLALRGEAPAQAGLPAGHALARRGR
jgi:hypothetical protein